MLGRGRGGHGGAAGKGFWGVSQKVVGKLTSNPASPQWHWLTE
jgi:hypothetical protein